ncbi:MAG: UDP-N-acetylmuramoyl-L-alanine--D-glutamate ligase [Patescibacteria group bacterium]|nr:UDP-N-acetylmuramoyl-L-alanine--D-glutamate ligase [Patescibacteria group bacterium]
MQAYKDYFAGKRITLMGLGLLGRGLGDAQFLAECGANLIVTDLKTEEQLAGSLLQLKEFSNITFHLGGHRLEDFKDRDSIIKAAGVPLDSPFITEAKKHTIPVRMSADLFVELSGAAVVGVTGTRGKSTVAHLVAHLLKQAGREVLLGGNVRGVSTLALLPQVTPNTIAVLELDSWQLQGFGEAKISPHIAVFTTFMPDHMNYYHNDMRAYFADKANIFLNQTDSDTLVLGGQAAPYIKEYGYQNKIKSRVITAAANNMPRNWQLKIPGEHNRYNAELAVEVARALGLDEADIKAGVETFGGVEGRLQLVCEINGIKIYNDNNATTPEATIAALKAIDPDEKKKIILIMGGADKGLDMRGLLQETSRHCKKVLLVAGTGTERIKDEVPGALICQSISEALEAAMGGAKEGDVILFSPAFASFGMFKNEYDRNDQFLAAVKALEVAE